eukprot:CAMPEP_0171747754 /NCGR_PEP_ID=MMETSP0991-20121206/39664_1 /TAXON_ID=483369 /ORGANISM="non described non described, Strain CCMP2098" /LENGTH=112 /DNA_ID=CAMNT_0012347917 /DNA_START=399 /DNA_END=735 /DNA_ORIENTATION=-
MKKELRLVIEQCLQALRFGSVPGAPEYATVLARRLKLKEAAAVVDADKWENDPAEKARRIWEWWVTRANDTTKFFNFWPSALRLVVLVQPPSASVERFFSQIKLIIEQIGVS